MRERSNVIGPDQVASLIRAERQVPFPRNLRLDLAVKEARQVKPTCISLSTLAQTYPGASLLEISDERDLWLDRLHAAERAAYERGYTDGDTAGYARGARLMEATAPVLDPAAPSLTELERRRWGPGGRQRFGDPRPGDFPGRP